MNRQFLKSMLCASLVIISISASAQSTKADTASTVQSSGMQTIKLKVTGVTCSGDLKDIAEGISQLKGVASCKPIGKASATTEFEVSFNPLLVSEKDIRKVVESTPGCSNPNDRPYKVKLPAKEIKVEPTQN